MEGLVMSPLQETETVLKARYLIVMQIEIDMFFFHGNWASKGDGASKGDVVD